MVTLQAAALSSENTMGHRTGESQGDATFADASTAAPSAPAKLVGILKNANVEITTKVKKKVKPKMTVKERKERNVCGAHTILSI